MKKNINFSIKKLLGLVLFILAVIIFRSIILFDFSNALLGALVGESLTESKMAKTKRFVCQETKTLPLGEEQDSTKLKRAVEDLIALNHDLKKNINSYRNADAAEKEIPKLQVQKVVKQRKDKLAEMMQRDPRSAIQEILSDKDRFTLNEISENCFEQEVTLEGQLEIVHGDNFEKGVSVTDYYLITGDGKKYILRPTAQPEDYIESRTRVKIKGWSLDSQVVFNSNAPFAQASIDGGFEIVSQPGNPPVYGEQRAAVLLVNFQNTLKPNTSTSTIANFYKSKINSYYTENSYGNISIKADVFGWYNIPLNQECIGSSLYSVWSAAITAADPYVYFPNYNRIIIIAPWQTCGYGGYGTIGETYVNTADGLIMASTAWIVSSYGTDLRITGHELGHNFGLYHANFYKCGSVSLAQSGCTSVEYGDIYDIMGTNKSFHFNSAFKEKVGWLMPANINTISASGIYTIEPIEATTTGFQALKLPIFQGEFLFFEYRQPIGYDKLSTSANIYAGPLIHLFSGTKGNLIDPTPPESKSTISIPLGMTWTDPATGAKIKTIEATAGKTTLDITLGKTDFTPPVISNFMPVTSVSSPATSTITLSVDATGTNGISKVEFYRYYAGAWVLIGTKTSAPYSVQLNTTKIPNGYSTIKVTAYDRSGTDFGTWNNAANLYNTIYIQNIDTVPPKIISLTPKNGTKVISPTVTSATVSDNAAVWYVQFKNDAGATNNDNTSPFSTSFSYSLGSHSLTAEAFDMVGNASGAASTSFEVVQALITSPSADYIAVGKKTVKVSVSTGVTLTKVEFYKDGETSPFAIDTTSPYSITWNTTEVSDGKHTLSAKTYDTGGGIFDVPAINLTVDNTPPSVSFSNPAEGAILAPGTVVNMAAAATDAVGLKLVKFLANGTLLYNDYYAPYSYNWKVGSSPTYVLEARAYDKAGNFTTAVVNVKTQ